MAVARFTCAPACSNAGSGDRDKPCFDGLGAERVGLELEALLLAPPGTL